MPLTIEKCVAYRCEARARRTLAYSTGVVEKPVMEIFVVEVISGGISGFGEFWPTSANYAPGLAGRSALGEWQELVATCAHLIGKDALQLRRLIPAGYDELEDANGLVDALDFALHDLVGRACSLPVWALLGGLRRREVPVMPVIHTDDDDAMVRRAMEWQERWGIRYFKLKPHAEFDADVRLLRTFSQRLRPGTRFLLDANFAYRSVEEAVKTLAEVGRYGVFLAEDPIETDYATLRERVRPVLNRAGVKLMLDCQARTTRNVFDIAAAACADAINFHANWHSGFASTLGRAAIVQAAGMENFIGSSIYMGIADAANIVLASVCPALICCEQVRGTDFYISESDSVVDDFFPLREGLYRISDAPGLGVEVNRARLERLTVLREEVSG